MSLLLVGMLGLTLVSSFYGGGQRPGLEPDGVDLAPAPPVLMPGSVEGGPDPVPPDDPFSMPDPFSAPALNPTIKVNVDRDPDQAGRYRVIATVRGAPGVSLAGKV